VAALLWLYSLALKKFFLIGNVIVAGLSALVFVMPVLFETNLSKFFQTEFMEMATATIVEEMKWYFVFAFIISLVREIAKDAEDKEADAAYDMKTLAVVLPRQATNAIMCLLLLLVMFIVVKVQMYFWQHGLKKHFWYALFLIQFPLLTNFFQAVICKTQKDYHNLAVTLKLLMFFGIASMPVFCWIVLSMNK
jgi:4-hydroxybenzoate polyprenyltransferase